MQFESIQPDKIAKYINVENNIRISQLQSNLWIDLMNKTNKMLSLLKLIIKERGQIPFLCNQQYTNKTTVL